MGNVAICLVGKRTVRVVRPDGIVEELDYKVGVSELMQQYEGYMVVHCSSSGNALGQRSKISIMNPEEKLVPGEAYVLYPIPAQFRQSFNKYLSPPTPQHSGIQSNGSSANDEGEDENSRKLKRRRKASSLQAVVVCLIRLLKRGSPSDTPLNDGSSPLLDSSSREEDNSLSLNHNKDRYQSLSVDPYAWRPALEAIPESPFGYHDMPQSPFSFDGGDRTTRSAPQSPLPKALSSNTNSLLRLKESGEDQFLDQFGSVFQRLSSSTVEEKGGKNED
ncbi:hypothetical protein R1flu_016574 [Riccia fluitans]|uniref:Uncharacterized protein n=1 Tax=Riccia fluitans TaxID=41844 RepID=A0ABD1YMF6_9MARC